MGKLQLQSRIWNFSKVALHVWLCHLVGNVRKVGERTVGTTVRGARDSNAMTGLDHRKKRRGWVARHRSPRVSLLLDSPQTPL